MTVPISGTEWKVLTAQIIIGIVGGIELVLRGDGNVLAAVITAEATLGGVQIALASK